ncbi:leucine-rich repeat domain-containing protein [Akkermansiaceae bacterium]|nr:leucine-rich repeat domain-containing protein [Akkermansiaceae bacterium]MDA7888606.1 leucine-rich repeat domain-containing protein [Akkermansiaceae bacterium]MDB4537871.1 leucine-rich repeat domain-containing protein [Akkermansiaceae bacterium]
MKPLQALLAILVCASLPLHAASLADLTYTTNNGKVTITDCDEAATGELVIPNTIQGNPVVYIGEAAFERCVRLTRVTIPEGVTNIGPRGFLGNTLLEEILLPQSLINIQESAFRDCFNLRNLILPPNLFTISARAFSNCYSLRKVIIPDSVISTGQSVFQFCLRLEEITFGNNLIWISDYTCSTCSNLKKVILGENIREIKAHAFQSCEKLAEISLPPSVTWIGDYAFGGASNLRKVNIPDNVINIGSYAFNGCSLKRIVIPARVTNIGTYTFSNSYDLHSLIFLGPAPQRFRPFQSMTIGTTVYIQSEHQDSFGGESGEWEGLPVKIGNGPSTPPVRIHFPTVEGVTYGMQNSIDLVNWRTEPFPIMGDAKNRYDRFVDPSSGPKIFYRLKKVD